MVLITWILIGILIVLAVVLLRFKEIRHRVGLFIIILLVLFLVVSIGYVTKVNKADLGTFDGIVALGKIYFNWLLGVGKNVVSISGYAVKQDWGLNFTNSTGLK